jgi:hypothetical protein
LARFEGPLPSGTSDGCGPPANSERSLFDRQDWVYRTHREGSEKSVGIAQMKQAMVKFASAWRKPDRHFRISWQIVDALFVKLAPIFI